MQSQYLSDLQALLNCREQVKTQARRNRSQTCIPHRLTYA
jgi:hypothetical protein